MSLRSGRLSVPRLQCHGLWDEDDPGRKKEPPGQSESEDESKGREPQSDRESEPASSVISGSRSSSHTSRSASLGTSIDLEHVQVHVAQQQTYQRRRSSSGGSHISHRSLRSSARSKRGEPSSVSVHMAKAFVRGGEDAGIYRDASL